MRQVGEDSAAGNGRHTQVYDGRDGRGQHVLDWILDSLAHAGIEDIVFIGGYQMEKVVQAYPYLRFSENTDWPDNNILESYTAEGT